MSESFPMALPLTALMFFALIGCAFAVWIARTTHRLLSFRFLAVANYVALNLVSGIVHILDLGSSRGYFDAVRSLEPQQLGQLVLIQGAGLIGLCLGILTWSPAAEMPPRSEPGQLLRFDRGLLLLVGGMILPIAIIALLRIREYASSLAAFGGRIISVDGGMARYVFMSHWLVWTVSFAVIWLAYGPLRQARRSPFVITITAVIVIAASFAWSGGRSIVLVYTLPLILVMLPLLGRYKLTATVSAAGGAVALLLYVRLLSDERNAASRLGAGNVADWIDWEWGRFSMLGFGIDYVDKNGLLFGETMLSSLRAFLGYTPSEGLPLRKATDIASTEILNSSSARFLAPGLNFELYVNMGLIGCLLGFFLLGWAVAKVDQRFAGNDSPVFRLFWGFLGTLLVFRAMPLEPSAVLVSLVYSGAPLIVVSGVSYLSCRLRRGEVKTRQPGVTPVWWTS